ncbi:MAG: DUF4145 domain-containing protein [Nitrosopumilus sp.]
MSKEKHYAPVRSKGEYHCPHCNVYSKQFWAHINANTSYKWTSFVDSAAKFNGWFPKSWSVSKCQHCGKLAVWNEKDMIFPKTILVENPNSDLSEEIQKDYLEAATVFNDSPRASAALLRLALQKLCIQLGEKGENINDDIKNLVKKGLNPLVQKSLDSLRITGNNAVHPGIINLVEEPSRVTKLFELLNFIANKMITEPKEVALFYDGLPEKAKKAIEKRDGVKKS